MRSSEVQRQCESAGLVSLDELQRVLGEDVFREPFELLGLAVLFEHWPARRTAAHQ